MIFEDDDNDDDVICCGGAANAAGVKKKRLGTEQVRALEQSFNVENRLKPEQKEKGHFNVVTGKAQFCELFELRELRWKVAESWLQLRLREISRDGRRPRFGGMAPKKVFSLRPSIWSFKQEISEQCLKKFLFP
ncbi:homeobox-leucine zipper protein HOX20-like [Dendrobium catenatum]|uniref:homeobox-leucine zipper protein HOX20-like n=1 Tax=Dendrobium catenatum TaxID=906689 RepID=UPI0009F3022A|nr:homeobox-leucine zipper protein HOX20-like [Dendrobium catenatum]